MADTLDPARPAAGETVAHAAEVRWALLVGAIIAFLLGMIVYMSLHWAAMPPVRTETIDPATLHLSGEFVEANLGAALEDDGSVTVRLLANQYSFTPSCLLLPADTPVRIRGTSADVVHGFSISEGNVNVMLVPGYVSNFEARFARTGEHLMPCHEYCGTGHAAMWARVRIVGKADFAQRAHGGRRVSCVGQ
ncbi:cytochrome C oxidase subunit II [Massilia sp. IC2-477]|uniref:cytochrome C oxidase subunit II n=1 Tax=Massilia sp. IC2-477 TaxID=2887198 RepID=UPI001D106145|nr:cytochrome C oxidase subunit II [Massilia sp. IC2-477]MCC2957575.1 cytochrome C oxidase subunit II [Massilia sp. IC2-477]